MLLVDIVSVCFLVFFPLRVHIRAIQCLCIRGYPLCSFLCFFSDVYVWVDARINQSINQSISGAIQRRINPDVAIDSP